MMYERYRGSFCSIGGIIYTVSILQEADKAFASVGELQFPWDEPITIEWDEKGKEEVICSSSATLTVISPGDRTYEDLYTIKVGTVRMDVYRGDSLYWSGTLDPEFYEEPYSSADSYEVQLTFSDFGVLDRLNFDMSGILAFDDIVKAALVKSGIHYVNINEKTSLSITSTSTKFIRAFSVASENFYDEDGEPSTWSEVLEGVLKPLGVKIIQRAGDVHIYDLHSMYQSFIGQNITWMSDDQMLGVDRVFNKIKISLSTYAKSEVMTDKLTNYVGENGTEYLENMAKQNGAINMSLVSFRLASGSYIYAQKAGLVDVNTKAQMFHITPVLGGDESTGVAWMYDNTSYTVDGFSSYSSHALDNNPCDESGEVLFRTPKKYLPKVNDNSRNQLLVRLTLESLIDARYNPFSDAKDNYEGDYNFVNKYCYYAFVAADVIIYDANGTALYYLKNNYLGSNSVSQSIAGNMGIWIAGAPSANRNVLLAYYDTDDRVSKAGIGEWKNNRQFLSLSTGSLSSQLKKNDGQFMPYPPVGGYVQVTIYAGMTVYDNNKSGLYKNTDVGTKIKWMLFKTPKFEIVYNDVKYSSAECDDVEYNAWINKDAADSLGLDTVCGTAPSKYSVTCPSAKCHILDTSTLLPVTWVYRSGKGGGFEDHLLSCLYSQFATRKTKLNGTTTINWTGLRVYFDKSQGTKKFILTADVQDLKSDTSESTFVELRPAEYTIYASTE